MQQHGGGEQARIAALLCLDAAGVLPNADEMGGVMRAVIGRESLRQQALGERSKRCEGGGKAGEGHGQSVSIAADLLRHASAFNSGFSLTPDFPERIFW